MSLLKETWPFATDCFKKKAATKNAPKTISANLAEIKQEINATVKQETTNDIELALATGGFSSEIDHYSV